MMLAQYEPFLDGVERYDPKSPTKPFDPKAVTRASFEPKPKKFQQKGPLISFNRHPDVHSPMSYRATQHVPMSRRTKSWIVWMRKIQLILRLLGLNASLGILAMTILITGIDDQVTWALRIVSGLAALHCAYGIYHLARAAGGRTPSSSAAYQFFAVLADFCVAPVYAYGAKIVTDHSEEWSTLLSNKTLAPTFALILYCVLLAAGGLQILCLCISLWLGVMFRRIALMPPDMNPLEEHLTARSRHKRAKSSISTCYTEASFDKRLSTASTIRGPVVPFHSTRSGLSVTSSNRDSRLDLPSRHYQIAPGASPRHSVCSTDIKTLSTAASRLSQRGSYVGIPMDEPSMGNPDIDNPSPVGNQKPRGGKFTETWHATDSLISRTQQRNRVIAAQEHEKEKQSWGRFNQSYAYGDSNSDGEKENEILTGSDCEDSISVSGSHHPNPLRLNPAAPPRPKTPYYAFSSDILSDMSTSKYSRLPDDTGDKSAPVLTTKVAGYRNSSIQPDVAFYSKPYGELKPATPPIMVGSNRHVSSGNDYDGSTSRIGRRNVSGKVAEEGRAGRPYERYGRHDDM